MYFQRQIQKLSKISIERKKAVYNRNNRLNILGSSSIKLINVGDIIKFFFCKDSSLLSFEGICISIKKKKFVSPDSTFILRNIIFNVGIE